jgi:hypothetical protein
MRAAQLVKALERLKLKPASKHTAKALGVSLRQLQRMTAGHVPVSRPVALLTISYLKHGVPNPLWNPELEKADVLQEATSKLHAMMKLAASPVPRAPPEARKIEALAPEPPIAPPQRKAPKPPMSIRSKTRRPAELSKAYIKEIADRAERK